ncbi:MAG TPA: von Willebrand factor type A domain-containing protein [Candidatus Didemnitutus sp.]
MSTNRISPDDPRLTAYALDELDPDEKKELERTLESQPEARAWIEEIRAVTNSLGSALGSESVPADSIRAAEILASPVASRRPGLLRFPYLYFVVSGLAAACFAVLLAIHDRDHAALPQAQSKDVLAEMNRPSTFKKAAAPMVSGLLANRAIQLGGAEFAARDSFFPVADAGTSTFPLHVGRESYDAVRRTLMAGRRPPRAAVQVAEMINAFSYSWPEPKAGEAFVSVLEESSAPWNPAHRLVRVGLRATGPEGLHVADDARVQVTFNPKRVGAWRLIGFNRDRPAAGVAGSAGEPMFGGAPVTVLYELVPPVAVPDRDAAPELLTLELRYRLSGDDSESLAAWSLPAAETRFADSSADMKFIAAVAAFGIGLQGTDPTISIARPTLITWADQSATSPERAEFLDLVRGAENLRR